MDALRRKLHDQRGVSMLMALLLMLVALMVSAVVVAGASSAVSALRTDQKQELAGNAYTDLNDFTVDLSGLTAVDGDGNALDGTRWTIYAGDVIEVDDYRYRLLTVETDQPRRLYISGTVTLRRNGVTYRLTLTNYPCGADPAP